MKAKEENNLKKNRQVESISIDLIEFGINPKRFNPKNQEHINEVKRLAKLIERYGQIQPIDITPFFKKDDGEIIVGRDAMVHPEWKNRKKRYMRLDGERRMRAIRDVLHRDSIDAIIKLRISIKEFIDIKWITCAKRVEINPLDMAIAIKEFKIQHPEVKNIYSYLSNLTGYSEAFFRSRDLINDASPELKKMVEKDWVKANVMGELRNIPDKYGWRQEAEAVHVREGANASTLFPRMVKPRLLQAIDDYEHGVISEDDLKEQGSSLIKHKGIIPKETLKKPDFPLYERELLDFISQVRKWNIGSDNDLERHKKLSGLFQELHAVWDTLICELYPSDRRGIFSVKYLGP